ncbi:prepronociceptin [Hypomesus transpacificus]|uniref:prepronociceptin n=1 Tax=Hypomesus transpacificus TaxID=137520 RepID=UPI001F07CACB|nr:prepronociceptin [Hypomesus transpacificus]
MKSPMLALLLLCLCVPGHCNCQAECFSCAQLLPKELNFNIMVCVVECEGSISSAYTWDLCRKASVASQFPSLSLRGTMLKRAQERVEALLPEAEEEQGEEGLLYGPTLQRYDQVSHALGLDQLDLDSWNNQLAGSAGYNSQQPQAEEEVEGEGVEGEVAMEQGQEGAGLSLSKRFGGFLKGKHGYRKLMDPGRSFQKRYGGFIGVRKSARKWNNQKRFSEFLKQYLGMSTRASEYNSMSEDFTQQSEV